MGLNLRNFHFLLLIFSILTNFTNQAAEISDNQQNEALFQQQFQQLEKRYSDMISQQEIEKLTDEQKAAKILDFLNLIKQINLTIDNLTKEQQEKYSAILAYIEKSKTAFLENFAIYRNKQTLKNVRTAVANNLLANDMMGLPFVMAYSVACTLI